jgi:hypothetical protein
VDARAAWTKEDILQESEGWVHLPSDGGVFRDERRLLVHLPERWGAPGGRASVSLRFVAFVAPASEDRGNYARRAVAAAGADVVGETVRLWGAGTLENYRGRDAYRALVGERCRIARSLGATLALTKANAATSAPILERAGFRSVAEERRRTLRIC